MQRVILLQGIDKAGGVVEFLRAGTGIQKETTFLKENLGKAQAGRHDDFADVEILSDDFGEEPMQSMRMRCNEGDAIEEEVPTSARRATD